MSNLPDSFAIYQSRISAFNRPERAEESAWIRNLRASEREMVQALICIGPVARHLMDLGSRIIQGEDRLDRWVRAHALGGEGRDREVFETRYLKATRLLETQLRLFPSSLNNFHPACTASGTLGSVLQTSRNGGGAGGHATRGAPAANRACV